MKYEIDFMLFENKVLKNKIWKYILKKKFKK